jgi:S-adenosylmethionine synthetase
MEAVAEPQQMLDIIKHKEINVAQIEETGLRIGEINLDQIEETGLRIEKILAGKDLEQVPEIGSGLGAVV